MGFPLFQLRGNAEEIGFEHGRVLKDRIHATWTFYRKLFGADDSFTKKLSDEFATYINEFNPDFALEIEAVAQGAELAPWQIFALNARTEIIRRKQVPGECTALYFAEANLLGENWDWAAELESLAVVLQLNLKGLPRILMLTEPGIVGKIGLNSEGLGVCITIQKSREVLRGVPVHILMRGILQCGNTAEALQLISKNTMGTMSALMIADGSGHSATVELSGTQHFIVNRDEPQTFHTNHYFAIENDPEYDYLPSSLERYSRVECMLKADSSATFDKMAEILGDRSHPEYPICAPYTPDPVISSSGTVCSIIMDLQKQVLSIRGNDDKDRNFQHYHLAS